MLTALHVQLNHPYSNQLEAVCIRLPIRLIFGQSHRPCNSGLFRLRRLTSHFKSSCRAVIQPPPAAIGVSFTADVFILRQLVLVLQGTVTSFTSTILLEDERQHTLRDALIRLYLQLRPLDGPHAIIRTDPAPRFDALVNYERLLLPRISIEIADAKSLNKNPVAERAIQELEHELLLQEPQGGPVWLVVTTFNLSASTHAVCLQERCRPNETSSRMNSSLLTV